MRKRTLAGVIAAGALLLGVLGASSSTTPSNVDTIQSPKTAPSTTTVKEKTKPTCDGTVVTNGCTLEGSNYKTYIYHAAVEEKTHTETITTYKEEVASYCTLCDDGTYSPSCATGRGACSHHGGVAQWNAPRYHAVPVENTKTIVDTPAKEAYYEKVLE